MSLKKFVPRINVLSMICISDIKFNQNLNIYLDLLHWKYIVKVLYLKFINIIAEKLEHKIKT